MVPFPSQSLDVTAIPRYTFRNSKIKCDFLHPLERCPRAGNIIKSWDVNVSVYLGHSALYFHQFLARTGGAEFDDIHMWDSPLKQQNKNQKQCSFMKLSSILGERSIIKCHCTTWTLYLQSNANFPGLLAPSTDAATWVPSPTGVLWHDDLPRYAPDYITSCATFLLPNHTSSSAHNNSFCRLPNKYFAENGPGKEANLSAQITLLRFSVQFISSTTNLRGVSHCGRVGIELRIVSQNACRSANIWFSWELSS